MHIVDALTLVSNIENAIIQAAREDGLQPPAYGPLLDELTQIRLRYGRFTYDPRNVQSNDLGFESEDEISLAIVMETLGVVRAMLVLPIEMLQAIDKSPIVSEGGLRHSSFSFDGQVIGDFGNANILNGALSDQLEQSFAEMFQDVVQRITAIDGADLGREAEIRIQGYLSGNTDE